MINHAFVLWRERFLAGPSELASLLLSIAVLERIARKALMEGI